MESKPSPIQAEESVKQARISAMKKRTGAFQADLVEMEKKHGLRLVAVLNSNHKGIFPGMIAVDPEDNPEYAAPHMKDVESEPIKKKKVLKKED
jgi:hypothetical protein